MRLNAQTDFSLRMMMYLATSGEPATIREISTKLGLSRAHMMRIAAKLASKGLVNATRGRSGGLALARDADLITIEDVVTAIEPDFILVPCFQPSRTQICSIEPACLLKGALSSALRAFLAELRAVTLAEITQPNQVSLAQIFRLNEPILPIENDIREDVSLERSARTGGGR